MSFIEIIIRVASSFFVLLLMTRIIGRKELRQLTFFNFASGIAIGSIAANLAVNGNLNISQGILALSLWALLTIVMGFVDIKAGKNVRRIVNGQPVIVIKDGKIMEKELRKARLDINDLRVMLREKNVFSVSDVDYAILETDGKVSILKKDNKKTITKSDMRLEKIKTDMYPLPTVIINDGNIDMDNLDQLDLDEVWVMKHLRQAGIQNVADVFYGELQTDGTLYIDKREDYKY
ncbi:YetF domain-containing protein [Virgibacillus byunsanensis]|uniref:YetF domain-containing protein n=1 Tax=Virgibacillus byunsanensis TaxID=570945 RepID=A0ABW3LN55_9BACI